MGGPSGKLRTAELFLPSAGTSCALPLFPEIRREHTLDNNIICGGYETIRDTCLKWSPDTGSWVELLCSLWLLIDISTSPGHRSLGWVLTSWEVWSVQLQLLWSKMMELKSQPSSLTIIQCRCFRNAVMLIVAAVSLTGRPVLSPTQTQWSSQGESSPTPLCPGTVSRDGWRTYRL